MPRIIFKKRIDKEFLTTKSTLIFIGLTAICGGYLLFLAIAAPQQLAEATTAAASNVVCSGCVGSSDIADNSILSADISNGRIFSEDIRDGQVGSVDIGTGQVASVDIQDNGITSADLGNVVTRVQAAEVTIAPGTSKSQTADCPSGQIVTGGGFFTSFFSNDAKPRFHLLNSYPVDANTWIIEAFNADTTTSVALIPFALCV
jgi:hypothetical protein